MLLNENKTINQERKSELKVKYFSLLMDGINELNEIEEIENKKHYKIYIGKKEYSGYTKFFAEIIRGIKEDESIFKIKFSLYNKEKGKNLLLELLDRYVSITDINYSYFSKDNKKYRIKGKNNVDIEYKITDNDEYEYLALYNEELNKNNKKYIKN